MDPLDENVRGHARDISQTTEEEAPLRVQHPLGPLLGSLPPDVLRNEVFERLARVGADTSCSPCAGPR